MSVAEIAHIWQAAGVSVLPIPANQSKRPDRKWLPYTITAPTAAEVTDWWGNGHSGYGLALICGSVSGNLEMTELEGKATDVGSLNKVMAACDRLNIRYLWNHLTGPNGFSEMSPTGGIHLLYRIEDAPVPGNTKVARRPATAEELAVNPDDRVKVLAETRGDGGYVITAPSPGTCHPSGEPWTLLAGQYGSLPAVSWRERNLLHQALFEALDEMPVPTIPAALPTVRDSGLSAAGSSLDLRPGDRWAAQTSFAEILDRAGWTMSHQAGEEEYWVRPGKNPRDGHSATVNYRGSNLLYVFSTAVDGLESETSYTKFGLYAHLFYGGDWHAATQSLVPQWGTPTVTLDSFTPSVILEPEPEPEPVEEWFTLDETGNAMRLARSVEGNFRYIDEEKTWYTWNGTVWESDWTGALDRAWIAQTEEMLKSETESVRKWGSASRSSAKIDAAGKVMRKLPGMTVSSTSFNPNRHMLNLKNGVLDLQDGILRPYDRSYLMTRTFEASFNPDAQCPEFEAFMAAALPDPAMRSYVQRALGYSILGDADQRSVFLIHGPSGTGKSTLMETMRNIFGQYGATAPASTFKASDRGQGPSPDLHTLRGKRFVTTSETSAGALFDEDLLKRLSGRDQIQSRSLYEKFVEWTPECALWLATNNPPKFNSDDDAIWRRAKLIPFLTVFTGEGERRDMARSVLAPERDGILNWLLAGLRDYQEHGLGEPEQVRELAQEQRSQSDPVARFVDEKVTDGILVMEPGQSMRTSELFAMYLEWSKQVGEKGVGSRRFFNRITSNFPGVTHEKVGHMFWVGIGRSSGSGILGTFST